MWKDLSTFLQHSFSNHAKHRKLNLRARLFGIQQLDRQDNDFHRSIMYNFICGCYTVDGSRITAQGRLS